MKYHIKTITVAVLFIIFSNTTEAQTYWNGNTTSSSLYGSALGRLNQSIGNYSFASGYGNIVSGWGAVSLGVKNQATGDYSLALGRGSYATGISSVSIGLGARATHPNSFSFGSQAQSNGASSYSFGEYVSTSNTRAFTIGTGVGSGTPLNNNIANSLMVGFNSNIPTLYVSASSGLGTTGNVGIGTITPTVKLEVIGSSHFDGHMSLGAFSTFNLSNISYDLSLVNTNAKVSFGDNNYIGHPNGGVNCFVGEWGIGGIDTDVLQNHGKLGLKFTIGNYQNGELEAMTIASNGNVGIGTNAITDNYKLSVDGKIRATQIEVSLSSNWADFVFEDDYHLAPLAEVEKFIEANKHLPNVPSEKEVASHGINLGEMDAILLRKIEELTLYIIELEKKVEKNSSR